MQHSILDGHVEDVPIATAIILWDFSGDCFVFDQNRHDEAACRRFQNSTGAGCYGRANEPLIALKAQLMIDAWHMVVRDKVPPDSVHREFLKIREYRDMLAGDLLPKEWRDEQGRGPFDIF